MNRKGKCTAHYIIIIQNYALCSIHMYRTSKVDMPEDFRGELSLLMSGIRITAAQDIQNRSDHCEVGIYPLFFPIMHLLHRSEGDA